jgi:hypothetical protein
MSLRLLSLAAVVALVGAFSLNAADEKKESKAMCPVSGKAIDMSKSVAYKGAKVYFCCGNCPGAFEKDTAKFSTKANHQLVVTEQFKEVKCPLSGAKLNPEATVEVAGTKVAFCCDKCQGKVAAAKGEEQLNLVFGDTAFAKGFEIVKKK